MAEIIGFVSAGISIVTFVAQITCKIENLKALRKFTPAKVADQLEVLSARLELLSTHLKELQPLETDSSVKLAIQQSSKRFHVVENIVETLQRQYLPEGNVRSGYRNKVKVALSRNDVLERINTAKDTIGELSDDINRACSVSVYLLLQQLQTPGATLFAHRKDPSLGKLGDPAMIQEPTANIEQTAIKTAPVREGQNQTISRGINHHHCGPRHCDCLCHLTGKKSGRSWMLEYTPLSILLRRPVTGRCGSSQFCVNFRLALSSYGIPFAIVAGLNITADTIGFTLQPAFRTERIVKYTSPGFETLLRLEDGNISFAEAQTKFVELYRSDPSFRHHRDPSGQGYLQLLKYPWNFRSGEQLKLLQMFVGEFGMSIADQDTGFLTMCAQWIGEGPHLVLLDAILDCGFDPTTVNSPLWEQWPESCSPNWVSEEYTPDPFFIEYLATLVKDNPNFSGSNPLCNAILSGSDKDIEIWLSRSQPLEESTTFLGQSPLHLAVTNPGVCQILLDAGHDLNVTDKWGLTPLMYAAGMGEKQTVVLLLSGGADPTIFRRPRRYKDHRSSRTFVHYAIARGHFDLVLDAIGIIQKLYDIEVLHACSQLAMMITISTGQYFKDSRAAFFSELAKNLADVNMSITSVEGEDDNNLMHYVLSVEEASALVRCGFNGCNKRNSDGKLAINSLTRHRDPALIKFCIDNGANVRNKDNQGRTILFDLLSNLDRLDDWKAWETLDSIRLCLANGVDIEERDNCKCPCSPDGCSLSSIFFTDFIDMAGLRFGPGLLWSLEWVTLVEEHCGVEAARLVLLSLLRRAKCDQFHIAIKHVCCHRGRGTAGRRPYEHRPRPLTDDEITEIIDEEREFIDILDSEMEQLASMSLYSLRSGWMSIIKAKYIAHVEAINKERAEYKPQFSEEHLRERFHVDYTNDTYQIGIIGDFEPTPVCIARSLASYLFWLQYEQARADNSSLREVRRGGWFTRRVSWLKELIDLMALSADEITAEARRIHEQNLVRGAVYEIQIDLDF